MAAKTMEEIAELLKELRFRKKVFGGIDEDDAWQVIEKLQREYRSVVEAERERCSARVEDRDRIIKSQREELKRLKAQDAWLRTDGGDAYGRP